MYFGEKALGNKSTREKTLNRLLKSPPIIAGSLKKKSFSEPTEIKTKILSFSPNEICDRLKLLEYKCKFTKQHSTLVEMIL